MKCRDEGSIMVLAIGLAVVVVSLVAVAVNVTALWVSRAALNSLSDGAALAGAQAVDEASVYTSGLGTPLVLDAVEARRRVRAYIARTGEASGLDSVAIDRITVGRASVEVTLSATAEVPFAGFLPDRAHRLVSTAEAVNALR